VQSRTPVRSGTAEWSWTISGVSDGTYQVGAQAEQSNGVVGPSVSIPVTLNRSVPTNPGGVMGGFNNVYVSTEATQTPVAELQWQANSERNVIGYRVFNPSGKEVCPGSPSTLSLELSCVDLNPPAPSASNLTYRVVPLYRDAGGAVAEGLATNFTLNGTPLSTYTLAPSTLNTGTNCSGASAKKDMLLGYTPGTHVTTKHTTVFCSNSFTAGATTQLGGTATVYLENKSAEKACTVTGELTVNGTITGPLKVENTIPKASAISPYKFSFAYKALPEPWPAGRFDLLLKFGSGCSAGTKLHYGSATYPSSFQTAPKPSPAPPNRPASLMLTPESGTVVLSWPAPSGGTAVSFYRIYRDGKLYTKRYDTANATETSYTDPNHTEKHSYYITAVSSTLAESEFLGPVSG
jgi:hypothetical protein